MLIDSHCHFNFTVFDPHRESTWRACNQVGIEKLIIPAIEPAALPATFSIAEAYNGIYCSAGLHPWWVEHWLTDNHPDDLPSQLNSFLHRSHCVAIGECGLDECIDTPMEQQRLLFEKQLQLACEVNLPVIVHVRKAHNQVLALLKKYRPDCGGVIHGFSGSVELAQSYWQLGFYIGVGGVITYPRANKTHRAVIELPLEALLLETDAPDMPLAGKQGTDNSPLYLPEVAQCLANLRAQMLVEIARQTTTNCKLLFNL